MKQRTINRREFLRLTAMSAVGVAAAACSPQAPAPATEPTAAPAAEPTAVSAAEPTAVPAAASKYKEAPMLAELVKAGKLPPVDERLPIDPMVMVGYEGIGTHGGTWRRCFSGVSDRWGPTKLVDRGWAWFDADLNLIPRILESWQASPDGKVWTIKLREGTKWSDGVPHTTADYAWWYEHELLNKKVTPGTQTIWADPDKTYCKFEVVDDYTARFTYGKPKPMFIYNMVRGGQGGTSSAGPITPSHFMSKLHEDTTDDKAALEADWKARGFASWEKFYVDWAQWWYLDVARPHLGGWVAQKEMSTELFVMERNPYFFAVDEEGNQLPYIDKVTHRLFENQETKNLWVTNGEIDMQYRHMSIADLALYKSGEAKGDYKVVLGVGAGHVAMQLNLTTKNQQLAEFFNERNVRIAISHAINREQINELVFNGMYKPRQYSPLPMSPQYYEKLSNAYLEYDPDKANQLLDEAGYDKKGPDGIRLHKDGVTPISFIVEHTNQTGDPNVDAWMLVSQDLEKVGIKATPTYFERALYTEHYTANDIEAAFWGGDRTVLPLVPEAQLFRGLNPDRPWAVAWGLWYTTPDSPNAVKPPDGHWIWDIWKIWDEEVIVEVDPAKQTEAFKKLLDVWATELPFIGILGEQPTPTIVKNGFKGYPAGMPNDDPTGDEQFCQSETYYWDDPSKHTV